jgi:hypothetical protein
MTKVGDKNKKGEKSGPVSYGITELFLRVRCFVQNKNLIFFPVRKSVDAHQEVVAGHKFNQF